MDKPLQLPGSVKIDFASALYAGKAEIAATTAALSHALGPPRNTSTLSAPSDKSKFISAIVAPVLCPSAFARKRPMSLPSSPPAKKLQVQQSSTMLPRAFPKIEVLPVEKPRKLQVWRAPQPVSPVLKQGSPKMEMPAPLPIPATSIDMMLSSQKAWSEMLSDKESKLQLQVFEMPEAEKEAEGLLVGKHTKGCNCKKSECLKKYCECFKSSVFCSENCKCTVCKNYESNEDRKAIHPITQQHTVYVHHVQNPASSGMIGQSVVLSNAAENDSRLSLAASGSDQSISNKASHALSCSLTSVPKEDTKSPVKYVPHEVTYRPILADNIWIEDVNELCNLLILVSKQAGTALFDSGIKENTKQKKSNRAESCLSSTNHDREAIQKEPDKQICSLEKSVNEVLIAESRLELPGADPLDIQKGNKSPLSPGTQALTCDEQDAVFHESKAAGATPSTTEENLLDIFKEQEKRVLTNFRDYLCKLANCGILQEQKPSLMSTNCEQTSAGNSNDNPSITRVVEVSRIRQTIPRFCSKYQSPGRLILAQTKMGDAGIGELMGQKATLQNGIDQQQT